MCGDTMHLKERVLVRTIAGTNQKITTTLREWVCPECDYFEEDEPERRDS